MTEHYDSRPDTYTHIARVRELLLNVAVMLIRRAHAHDASKLVSPEVGVFDEFTPKLKGSTYHTYPEDAPHRVERRSVSDWVPVATEGESE